MHPNLPICQVSANELNDLLKSLLHQMDTEDPAEAVRRITSCEWVASPVACGWREENGVISFSLTSDGTTGPEWIERLQTKGFQVQEGAREVLLSPTFQPTTGITTKIALLTSKLFDKGDFKSFEGREVYNYANAHGLEEPNMEIACLMREAISNHEMMSRHIYIIEIMHKRFQRKSDYPFLLAIGRQRDNREDRYANLLGTSEAPKYSKDGFASCLFTVNGIPAAPRNNSIAFAFVMPN